MWTHVKAIVFSGFIWLGVGTMLLLKGLTILGSNVEKIDESSRLFLIFIGLAIGYVKGRYVLSRSAKRIVTRLLSLPLPLSIKNFYTRGYVILLFSMMALGMAMKYIPLPLEFRGCMDVAVGSALINGAMLYFRDAVAVKNGSYAS